MRRVLWAWGLVCCLLWAAPAAAASRGDTLAALFPDGLQLARHAFASPPVQVSLGAPLPAELAFTIALPAPDWCRVGPDLSLQPAQRLAGFVSPRGRDFGVIEVLSHQLQAEVGLADWLLAMLSRSGVVVLKSRSAVAAGGPVFEALGVLSQAKDDQRPPTLVRVAVMRSGQRLFIVRCLAREDAFAGLIYPFAAATLLFKPARVSPPTLVGNWRHQCLTKSGVCFLGPARGRAEVPWGGRPVEEAGFELQQAGVITGTLHVKAVSGSEAAATGCEQRIQLLAQDLARRGVKVDWITGGIAVNHPNLGSGGCYYRGRGFLRGEEVELFVFSWSGRGRAVVVWLLSVGQLSNLPAWMQNKRAFEVVCRSLKLSGG